MKLITRDTDYAIRAVCFLAKSKKTRVSADELVKELKIPRPFLRKILQVLSKKKLLKSYRGQGGGFTLTIAPSKISLVDLVETFQGRLKLNECTFKRLVCPDIKICKVKKKIDNIQKYVISELRSVTIASLVKQGG